MQSVMIYFLNYPIKFKILHIFYAVYYPFISSCLNIRANVQANIKMYLCYLRFITYMSYGTSQTLHN